MLTGNAPEGWKVELIMRGGPRRRCPARKVKRQDWLCRVRWSMLRPLRLRYTIRPPHRKPTTWSCKPWAARQRQENQRRQSRCRRHRTGLHQRRHPDAHQRAAHLRYWRHRRPAHARTQGGARITRSSRSDSRRVAGQQGNWPVLPSTPESSRVWPTPTPKWPGWG